MLMSTAIILAALAISAGGILAYASTKPDSFRIARTAAIDAPPDIIFRYIEDLHRFGLWSPYENKDPSMRCTYRGAERGKGAIYEWDGNRNIGKGRMTIAESLAPSKVTIDLEMI